MSFKMQVFLIPLLFFNFLIPYHPFDQKAWYNTNKEVTKCKFTSMPMVPLL